MAAVMKACVRLPIHFPQKTQPYVSDNCQVLIRTLQRRRRASYNVKVCVYLIDSNICRWFVCCVYIKYLNLSLKAQASSSTYLPLWSWFRLQLLCVKKKVSESYFLVGCAPGFHSAPWWCCTTELLINHHIWAYNVHRATDLNVWPYIQIWCVYTCKRYRCGTICWLFLAICVQNKCVCWI